LNGRCQEMTSFWFSRGVCLAAAHGQRITLEIGQLQRRHRCQRAALRRRRKSCIS
jgi:hypothetical protein